MKYLFFATLLASTYSYAAAAPTAINNHYAELIKALDVTETSPANSGAINPFDGILEQPDSEIKSLDDRLSPDARLLSDSPVDLASSHIDPRIGGDAQDMYYQIQHHKERQERIRLEREIKHLHDEIKEIKHQNDRQVEHQVQEYKRKHCGRDKTCQNTPPMDTPYQLDEKMREDLNVSKVIDFQQEKIDRDFLQPNTDTLDFNRDEAVDLRSAPDNHFDFFH